MKQPLIFHIDINHCFAQIEEMKVPELRDVPMCVGGDETKRSGIVLARNLKAKEYGVTTAETLRDAYRKCPDLVVVPAHYDDYIYITSKIKELYQTYTDRVESYGLDEAWLDMSYSYHLFGKPFDVAYKIQREVYERFGLTVSVGVSWNKVFAKLGSDLKKPMGMTIITPSNYQEVVWPLEVEALLFVGRQTTSKLHEMGIYTIGDLAQCSPHKLTHRFGIKGKEMWRFANGDVDTAVDITGTVDIPKSIGNSTTPPHDLVNLREAGIVVSRLAESVASRLRDEHKVGTVISVSPRDVNLKAFTRQRRYQEPLVTSKQIYNAAMKLLEENYDFDVPLRSIGINVSHLMEENTVPQQLDLFNTQEIIAVDTTVDDVVQTIRDRFGFHTIKSASSLLDKDIENFDAKNQNSVFPGRKKAYDTQKRNDNKILYKRDKELVRRFEDYIKYKESK